MTDNQGIDDGSDIGDNDDEFDVVALTGAALRKMRKRIAALFNRADHPTGPDDAEAERARERALALSAKYGIAETEARAHGTADDDEGSKIRRKDFGVATDYFHARVWLLMMLAVSLHCRAVVIGDRLVVVIGAVRHIERVVFYNRLLSMQMINATGRYMPKESFVPDEVARQRHGFALQFAKKVTERVCVLEMDALKHASEEARNLIWDEEARARKIYDSRFGGVTEKYDPTAEGNEGARAGGIAGATADIHQTRIDENGRFQLGQERLALGS